MNPPIDSPETAKREVQTPNPGSLPTKSLSLRLIGIGGAGGNVVAHMAQSDLRQLRLVALHTNARVLELIQAPEKILLGADITHGLGAGGDPSLAHNAAECDADLLKELCQAVDLLFIVAGLGGGTGTGVAPVLARVAKECGALVLGVVTLPFELEGVRRRHHAERGLHELRAVADAVICLENQKMFRLVDEKTTVLESLKITNSLLSQGVRGIWQMLTRPSLIHVDFSDLASLLRDRHAESSFATAEAQGEGRAREVIEQLLASPFLEGGQVLADAESLLVNLAGGPDLSMADVKRVMEEINRRTDNAHLVIGASIDDALQGRLALTLVASRRPSNPTPEPTPRFDGDSQRRPESLTIPIASPDLENRLLQPVAAECGTSRFTPPPCDIPSGPVDESKSSSDNGKPKRGKSPYRFQQTHLPLEMVAKGRFEKSPPTIHHGEDLDVPTYLRRGIPLN